jgi:hypothetical protein
VHVHTGYSFDAFTNGSPTVPSDAYEWARGKTRERAWSSPIWYAP